MRLAACLLLSVVPAGCVAQLGGPEPSADAGENLVWETPDASALDAGSDAGTKEPALSTVAFAEATGELANPERGFYDVVDLLDGSSLAGVRTKGMTLA